MTYSEVVLVLSSHMVPKDPQNPMPNQQIAVLEKFIQESEQRENGEQPVGNTDLGLSELGYGASQDNQMPD